MDLSYHDRLVILRETGPLIESSNDLDAVRSDRMPKLERRQPNYQDYSFQPDGLLAAKSWIYDRVASRYSQQGPERAKKLGQYAEQNRSLAHRTYNFLYLKQQSGGGILLDTKQVLFQEKWFRPTAHVQVQVTNSLGDWVNTELNLKRQLSRKEGQRVGDFGRLLVLRSKEIPLEMKEWHQFYVGRMLLSLMVDSFGWFLFEYGGDLSVFTVSTDMLSIIGDILPLDLANSAQTIHPYSPQVSEHLFIWNREQTLKAFSYFIMLDILNFLERAILDREFETLTTEGKFIVEKRPFLRGEYLPDTNTFRHAHLSEILNPALGERRPGEADVLPQGDYETIFVRDIDHAKKLIDAIKQRLSGFSISQ